MFKLKTFTLQFSDSKFHFYNVDLCCNIHTRHRGGRKRLSDEAAKKLQAAPHPRQREKRKRETYCTKYSLSLIIVALQRLGVIVAGSRVNITLGGA